MKSLIYLFATLLVFISNHSPAYAQVTEETLLVHGVMAKFKVEKKKNYSTYTLMGKTTFPLFGGNEITLSQAELSFYPDVYDKLGHRVLLFTVKEPNTTIWNFPDGTKLALSCGQRTAFERPRLITLYRNRQIQRGCRVGGSTKVPTMDGQKISVTAMSDNIDFSENGFVQYVRKGSSDSFKFQDQEFPLAPNREISYHKNGTPHFFTIAKNKALSFEFPQLGVLELGNPPGELLSMTFYNNGMPQLAFVQSPYEIKSPYFSSIQVPAGPTRFAEQTQKIEIMEIASEQALEIQGVELAFKGVIQFFDQTGDYKINRANLSRLQQVQIHGRLLDVYGQMGFFEESQKVLGVETNTVIQLSLEGVQLDVTGPIRFYENGKLHIVKNLSDDQLIKVYHETLGVVEVKVLAGDRLILNQEQQVIGIIPVS